MWTEDNIGLLRKLWGQGLSAAQIASRIGGVTRNAVIGKVHRLSLPRRATTDRAPRARKVMALPFRPTRIQLPSGAAAKHAANARPPRLKMAEIETNRIALASISAADPCGVLDIGKCMCRWPYGDPKEAGFHFCGRSTHGGSYCDPHAMYAYQPRVRRA